MACGTNFCGWRRVTFCDPLPPHRGNPAQRLRVPVRLGLPSRRVAERRPSAAHPGASSASRRALEPLPRRRAGASWDRPGPCPGSLQTKTLQRHDAKIHLLDGSSLAKYQLKELQEIGCGKNYY